MNRTTSFLEQPHRRHRNDQAEDLDAFHSYPEKFSPRVAAGTRVTPAFASQVEMKGPGRVLSVSADRATAVVRFERNGEEVSVEPWDVYADELEAGR